MHAARYEVDPNCCTADEASRACKCMGGNVRIILSIACENPHLLAPKAEIHYVLYSLRSLDDEIISFRIVRPFCMIN